MLFRSGQNLPPAKDLLKEAANAGVEGFLLMESKGKAVIGLYYTRIPLEETYAVIRELVSRWRDMV